MFAAKFESTGKFIKAGHTLVDADGDRWEFVEAQNIKMVKVKPCFGTKTSPVLVPRYVFGLKVVNSIYAAY
jgi:hypothetical protein